MYKKIKGTKIIDYEIKAVYIVYNYNKIFDFKQAYLRK